MSRKLANILVILAIVAELALTAYATLFAYLGSAWFTDDSWAFQATVGDWTRAAFWRFGTCLLVGVVVGVCTWQLNKWLLDRGARIPHVLPKLSGGIAGLSIVAASAVGAIQFVADKPWL